MWPWIQTQFCVSSTSRATAHHAAVNVKNFTSCGVPRSCCSPSAHFGMLYRNSCFLSELTAAFHLSAQGLLSPCLKSTALQIYKSNTLIQRERWRGKMYRNSREGKKWRWGEAWSETENRNTQTVLSEVSKTRAKEQKRNKDDANVVMKDGRGE